MSKADTSFPTPLAQVLSRLHAGGVDESADCFLKTSYVTEVTLKLMGLALASGLSAKAPDHAYRMRYQFVRANGLGTWDQLIREMATPPLSGFLDPSMLELARWISRKRTKREDEWFQAVIANLTAIFEFLGLEPPISDRKPSVRDAITSLVELRNKTKAHGAVGDDFFAAANSRLVSVALDLIGSCPLFSWPWLHLSERPNGTLRAIWLRGTDPQHTKKGEVEHLTVTEAGVHVWPSTSPSPLAIGELLQTDRECRAFVFPNGSYTDKGKATFLDYWTGREKKAPVVGFRMPPASLPPSETEGRDVLMVHSNVFGNLPPPLMGYVRREELEASLAERLRDLNHPVITLHGRGGIGKTSLALRGAYELAEESPPVFEHIVWFSARDVDLALHGPRSVRPTVVELDEVARHYGTLFGTSPSVEGFARVLREADQLSGRGTLFVFDNFETMRDPKGIQQFLDTHTHIPNKVLITSRERAFKADFPIEVQGMNREEADLMMVAVARELNVSVLIDERARTSIFTFAEGHPYVMRILVGEAAKGGAHVTPKTLMPQRIDILEAVFERSFNKLSPTARWIFLITSNWRSAVSEAALLVVLTQRGLDADRGIDECTRLSMITKKDFLDGYPAYAAPQVARLYGRKKLEGDADRLLIQEDLALIKRFGVLPTQEPIQVPHSDVLNRFTDWCLEQVSSRDTDPSTVARLDAVLETLGSLWPQGWTALARFREESCARAADIEYAFRRAVEENPGDKGAWLLRAQYAERTGDDAAFISARIRAVELDPTDLPLVRAVALDLAQYITRHAQEIPVALRGVYLASVRGHMTALADGLDGTGLSRLAWLYLQEGNEPDAWRYASKGLKIDPHNEHCYKLIQGLLASGFEGLDPSQ